MSARVLALATMLLLVALNSCGGGAASLPETESGSLALNPPSVIGEAEEFSASLPGIDDLAPAARSSSIAGPGWHSIEPYVDGGFSAVSNATQSTNGIELSGGTKNAYAVYPVMGFNAETYPTSARLGLNKAGSGRFYVACADYKSRRWSIAGPFTGAATVEFPGLTDAADSHRYVSPFNVCYLAIIVEAGGSFDFGSIELGLHSGNNGPRPPSLLSLPQGEEKLSIDWLHSPDYTDPDFAGYRLERAPQLFGDYLPLTADLLQGTSYLDEDIEPGKGYRYRLAAEGTSGNRSNWLLFDGFSQSGVLNRPVLVVHAPQGPLYGPLMVDVDCGSDSYDPEGVGINMYSIVSPGSAPLSPPDGKASLMLYPGCNIIQCSISTSDSRFSTQVVTIKVLPQWEDTPVLVADTPAKSPARLQHPTILFSTITGMPSIVGYEAASASFSLWDDLFDPETTISRLPAYWPVDNMSRAYSVSGEITFLAAMDSHAWIARFGDFGNELHEGPAMADPNALDIAVCSNDNSFLICTRPGSVSDDLVLYDLENLGEPFVIQPNIGDVVSICAAGHQNGINIDIFCQTTTEVIWHRTDINNKVSLATRQVVNSGMFNQMNCEIDPETGRPLLMLHDTYYKFSAQDVNDDFPLLQLMDNTMPQKTGGSMYSLDHTYATFADNSGQTRVYSYNGSGWDVHAVIAYTNDSGLQTSLGNADAQVTTLMMADVANDGSVNHLRVYGAGTNEVRTSLPPALGQGSDMHAISGAGDVLHACWLNTVKFQVGAAHSIDSGQNWTALGPYLDSHMTCGTEATGNIYTAGVSGTIGTLQWFDGSIHVIQKSVNLAGALNIPMLAKRNLSDDTSWSAYNPVGSIDDILVGHYDTGTPGLDYVESMPVATVAPLWDGVINSIGNYTMRFARAGGGVADQGQLLVQKLPGTGYDTVVPSIFDDTANMQLQSNVRTRGLATCSYLGPELYLHDQAFFSTYGAGPDAIRYTLSYGGDTDLSNLAMPSDPLVHDARRTVSCDSTPGYTGLMILSDAEGRDIRFEWSNFGDWEPIGVPEQLKGASMHEIVCDEEGRWHVFYRDRFTDQIWMLSTK